MNLSCLESQKAVKGGVVHLAFLTPPPPHMFMYPHSYHPVNSKIKLQIHIKLKIVFLVLKCIPLPVPSLNISLPSHPITPPPPFPSYPQCSHPVDPHTTPCWGSCTIKYSSTHPEHSRPITQREGGHQSNRRVARPATQTTGNEQPLITVATKLLFTRGKENSRDWATCLFCPFPPHSRSSQISGKFLLSISRKSQWF